MTFHNVVGITGTRRGLAPEQVTALNAFLNLTPNITFLRHGDCVGADAQVKQLVEDHPDHTTQFCCHPPENSTMRAWTSNDTEVPPKPYLDRNRDIVDGSNLVLAFPGEMKEVYRSGTWATIRYARKQGKQLVIFWLDGTLTFS